MFEKMAWAHLSLKDGRYALEQVSLLGQQLQNQQGAIAPPPLIAQTVDELSIVAANVRVCPRVWNLLHPNQKNMYTMNGYHARIVQMAEMLMSVIPQPLVRDEAVIYRLSAAQWLASIAQYRTMLQQHNVQLPQTPLLDGEFSNARTAYVADWLGRGGQERQTAILAANAALAAPGNIMLMSQASDAKRLFINHADEALRTAHEAQQRQQIKLLLTQGYAPLDQIST